MSKADYKLASIETVYGWFLDGTFSLVEDEYGTRVYKNGKELTQRINTRKGMDDGDPRVDLRLNNLRRSCTVSRLVWIVGTGMLIPDNFEIHHLDEDPRNNAFHNLICVHSLDHGKLHAKDYEDDEVPF